MPQRTDGLTLAAPHRKSALLTGFLSMLITLASSCHAARADGGVKFIDQGSGWTPSVRSSYYASDMGSRLIPYDWARSLRQPDGKGFLRDHLKRYGFFGIPKSALNPKSLAGGFLVTTEGSTEQLGIGCASCHSREIQVAGKRYRIDGAPGHMDFENFLRDLDTAVDFTLQNAQAFNRFSSAVLGVSADEASRSRLKTSLEQWHVPFHALISGSLDRMGIWGGGRLDALTLIQNKVTGLATGDIGDNYLITGNIRPADAPSKPFFLWNTYKQDFTGWTGQLPNGTDDLAMIHNIGVALGSFTEVRPVRDPAQPLQFDYLLNNSINYDGIAQMQSLIKVMEPPRWAWRVDQTLATQGRTIYDKECASCHGIKPGLSRIPNTTTWSTHVENVGTDTREWSTYTNRVKTGTLAGAPIGMAAVLGETDYADSVVGAVALGVMLQKFPEARLEAAPSTSTVVGAYEARVLQGVWATAPYLHNASVPSLAELLKPPAQRVRNFEIGPVYDTKTLGLAKKQPNGKQGIRVLTGCEDLDSGSSNCGHDYGTRLSDTDKKALLEYLKVL